jgi:acetyl-CoA acetyltransferase
MAEAYIVDALRSPTGKRKGSLAAEHPADLGAHVIKGLVERTGIDPAEVDDVIFGCVDTIGAQAGDIARTCWLAAGLPDSVPGHHGRPPVRQLAAGGALRGAGRDERHAGPGARRRRADR